MERLRILPWLIIFGILFLLQLLIFGGFTRSEWHDTPSQSSQLRAEQQQQQQQQQHPLAVPSCPSPPQIAIEQPFIPSAISQFREPQVPLPVAPLPLQKPIDDVTSAILPSLNANFDLAIQQEISALTAAHSCVAAPVTSASSFTRCMRDVSITHVTPPAAYAPRAACAHVGFCSGFGACFVGKCFCAAGRSGLDCATISPVGTCSMSSDACFRHPIYGSPRVSKERWFRAQLSEKDYWADASRAGDDNDNAGASFELFEGYAKVPPALGNVLELGCGPFTQLKSLLGNSKIPWSISTVTLADPILVSESKHAKSSFQSGAFEAYGKRYPTKLLQIGAEDVGQLYHDYFDTVIMQNVLEHVQDAYAVLESMYNATKPGGVVVFWEPMYGNQWSGWSGAQGQELLIDMNLPLQLDVASPNWNDQQVRDSIRSRAFDFTAHPIRVDPSVFDYFASLFDPIMLKREPGRRGDNSIVLIGRKKQACAKPYF